MPISAFDTLKYARRLEQAGMTPELAEVQAEVLAEAFMVHLEDLVTKDYFRSHLSAELSYLEARVEARMDTRFAEMKADFDGQFRTLYIMGSIILGAVILPYLERILAL